MSETGTRTALSGVDELVTFLGSASSNDRFAFSKRANVIFECRTCFTLFRKADGFMRHVMRCDNSRSGDVESESERRPLFASPANVVPTAKVSRVVQMKESIANGMASSPNTPAPVLQQNTVAKKPVVKLKVGRPSNAEKADMVRFPTKKVDSMTPIHTPPTMVLVASGSETKTSPSRAPKRAYTRNAPPKLTPQKAQKMEKYGRGDEALSASTKLIKSDDHEQTELSGEIRPSRMRKTPKWLEDSAFVV